LDRFIIFLQFSKHSVLIHLKTETQATVPSKVHIPDQVKTYNAQI